MLSCSVLAPSVRMAEVKVRSSLEIQVADGKWIHVPASLLEDHEGQAYLRMKATHHTIVALVTQTSVAKNASFGTSQKLQDLLKMRNEAAASKDTEEDVANEDGEKEDMWQDVAPAENPAPKKKRKTQVPAGSYVVEISVAGQPVHILCQGSRPTKADLLVRLVPSDLGAVFAFLKDDVSEALNAVKRQYAKKEKKSG